MIYYLCVHDLSHTVRSTGHARQQRAPDGEDLVGKNEQSGFIMCALHRDDDAFANKLCFFVTLLPIDGRDRLHIQALPPLFFHEYSPYQEAGTRQ